MKILHLGFSDTNGGAAIAMMRLHESLLESNIDSNVLVCEKLSDTNKVFSSTNNKFDKWRSEFKIKLARQKKFLFKSGNLFSHSINFFDSNVLKEIDKINPDIINLHWINNEFISIKQISKISKPIIWTMLDMWPMCGGEHYTLNKRYIDGYHSLNREKNESGLDLNKIIWRKKIKYFKNKIDTVVCISDWLKSEAKKSILFRDRKIVKINLPLNNNEWQPFDKNEARNILNLPKKKKIFLFVSTNGIKDFRKGFNFIDDALKKLSISSKDFLLVIVGIKSHVEKKPYEIKFVDDVKNGEVNKLKLIYSSADLLLAPSILEAQGQVAVESLSCGLPVVSFNKTGFSDVIQHKVNGYLSDYLDKDDFINGIKWSIKKFSSMNGEKMHQLHLSVNTFSSKNISKKYIDIYEKVLKKN